VIPRPAGNRLLPGAQVDHYQIERLLGGGSMGEVYLAQDTILRRPVALKLIRSAALCAPRAAERFLFEARATARVHHPNIVTIHAVGEHAGRPYLVLEYVEGQTLRERLAAGRPEAPEAIRIALGIARALQAAHAKGILHRDLKPENVMLTRQELRVLDFGLAKSFEVQSTSDAASDGLTFRTETRGLRGTPAYMAPEQWERREATPATDVWALAVMLVELLTGRPPFAGGELLELARHVGRAQAEVPARLEGVPSKLAGLIGRCLAAAPGARPTVEELIHALEATPTPSAAVRSPWRWRLAAAAGATALLVALGFVATRQLHTSQRELHAPRGHEAVSAPLTPSPRSEQRSEPAAEVRGRVSAPPLASRDRRERLPAGPTHSSRRRSLRAADGSVHTEGRGRAPRTPPAQHREVGEGLLEL